MNQSKQGDKPQPDIYRMALHEKYREICYEILRVPGGWIYTLYQRYSYQGPDGTWSGNYLPTSIFVPLSKEFDRFNLNQNEENSK